MIHNAKRHQKGWNFIDVRGLPLNLIMNIQSNGIQNTGASCFQSNHSFGKTNINDKNTTLCLTDFNMNPFDASSSKNKYEKKTANHREKQTNKQTKQHKKHKTKCEANRLEDGDGNAVGSHHAAAKGRGAQNGQPGFERIEVLLLKTHVCFFSI